MIGIDGRYRLVDGTRVTQPRYASWFDDTGWEVENRGVDPDIEVVITPQDHAAGRDPQLERAVDLALERLAEHPAARPPDPRPARPAAGRPAAAPVVPRVGKWPANVDRSGPKRLAPNVTTRPCSICRLARSARTFAGPACAVSWWARTP